MSIKNDGHYFCRAGGNRPDGLNEPVTVYTLTLADQRHVVSEISNGVNPTQAYSAVYQARRIRLARKYLNGKKVMEETGENTPPST
ncbi:hypothetical protein IB382_005026 [Escherichia coli]|nr:hypothetical protein [Escherichia coli]EGF1819454.1 hypothetical protein [Escherichia coli]